MGPLVDVTFDAFLDGVASRRVESVLGIDREEDGLVGEFTA